MTAATSQPEAVTPARPGNLTRRPVAADDEEFLLQVYSSTRADEMALVNWSDAEKDLFLRTQLRAQKADYDARFPDAAHEIVLLDGQRVGQIWIGRSADEICLLDIALLPQFRCLGVGTALVKELQDEAARLGKTMRHCVYKPNQSALRFYLRLGFVLAGDVGMYHVMEWTPENPSS